MTVSEHVPHTEQFWLHLHQVGFLHSLAEQGHSERSIETYRRFCSRLCEVTQARQVGPEEFDVDAMTGLADSLPTTGTAYMKQELTMVVHRFTGYLIDAGVMVKNDPPPPPADPMEQLCMEQDHWLRSQRGMYGNRLRVYRRILTSFVRHCCNDKDVLQDLASMSPEDVLGFVDTIIGSGNWRIQYLRNTLRFLFWSNRIPRDLSVLVPRTAYTRCMGVPRHLDQETVHRLLEVTRDESPRDKRDHAMLLIMARLDLRAQEVIAIQLDDIDWNLGRMLVRGKQGQHDHMPIPVDVGEAIVSWLQAGRRGKFTARVCWIVPTL